MNGVWSLTLTSTRVTSIRGLDKRILARLLSLMMMMLLWWWCCWWRLPQHSANIVTRNYWRVDYSIEYLSPQLLLVTSITSTTKKVKGFEPAVARKNTCHSRPHGKNRVKSPLELSFFGVETCSFTPVSKNAQTAVVKNRIISHQCPIFGGRYCPSKIEWDLSNGPLGKLLELLDTHV